VSLVESIRRGHPINSEKPHSSKILRSGALARNEYKALTTFCYVHL